MPSLKVTVQMEIDGVPLEGFPKVRRVQVDELAQFRYEHANDGDTTTFTTIPDSKIAEIQALVMQSDQPVNIRLDGQTDAGIMLNAGGLLIIMDSDIDAGAGSNAKVNNNSGSTANIKGLAGGT